MRTDKEVKVNRAEHGAPASFDSRQKLAAQIERAKSRLAVEFEDTVGAREKLFRLALGEAEALAWQTGYPHLVFSELAVEKAQAVAAWQARQQLLDRRRPIFTSADRPDDLTRN